MSRYKKKQLLILLIFSWFSILPAPKAAPAIKWTLLTGGAVYSSPAYYNNAIYIGSDDFYLYCINENSGKITWKFMTQGIIRCKPVIEKGNVYFASDDGNLYSLNSKTGNVVWKFDIGNNVKRQLPNDTSFAGNYWDYMQSSPCIGNGTVYVGSGDSCLYAISTQNGKLKWKVKTGGIIRSSPCINDGMIYAGSWDGFIYAFNAGNGSIVWSFNTQGNSYKNVQPSPKVANGILYCGSRNPYFYAIDAKTGKEIWKHNYDFSWVESSAEIADSSVYVGSSDLNTIFDFDNKSGDVKWSLKVQGDTWSSPCYDNGILYIGLASYKPKMNMLTGGALLAIEASKGEQLWKIDCSTSPFMGGVVSNPLVHNNTIFYGSLDGKVYAVSR